MKKTRFIVCLLTLTLTTGCGQNLFEGQENKDSTQAKQLDTSSKLDSGNYAAVLNDPNVSAVDYTAAAMGLAGLDPVELIKAMNKISTSSSSTKNDISQVTNLPIDPSAVQYLQQAKTKLQAQLAANPTDPDLNFQMSLVSLTSTVTALAQVGQSNSGSITGGFNSADGISSSEANALGIYLISNPDATVNTGSGTATLVSIVASDVASVSSSLPNANLGTGSDLNNVITDATQGPQSIDYNGNGTVTSNDISNYLRNVIGQ